MEWFLIKLTQLLICLAFVELPGERISKQIKTMVNTGIGFTDLQYRSCNCNPLPLTSFKEGKSENKIRLERPVLYTVGYSIHKNLND